MALTAQAKNGGPYTKKQRDTRRDEVYKLYFDYGYSMIKISTLMKVNRHTIKRDIDFWSFENAKKWENEHKDFREKNYVERLELQRTRLRRELDKEDNFDKRFRIEQLISEIDVRILKIFINIRVNEKKALISEYSPKSKTLFFDCKEF